MTQYLSKNDYQDFGVWGKLENLSKGCKCYLLNSFISQYMLLMMIGEREKCCVIVAKWSRNIGDKGA